MKIKVSTLVMTACAVIGVACAFMDTIAIAAFLAGGTMAAIFFDKSEHHERNRKYLQECVDKQMKLRDVLYAQLDRARRDRDQAQQELDVIQKKLSDIEDILAPSEEEEEEDEEEEETTQ